MSAPTHPLALDTAEQILIETRLTNEGPSLVLAYLFWFFLGIVSAHRFYLGRPVTAVIQILTYFIGIGLIWLVVDAFLIPGLARAKRDRMREEMSARRLAELGAVPPALPAR
ncbi:hypothetical protein GCM10007301_25750 [Azorhizobium oxalatiphilum]|uniref:TM2 domain-containing protein n=1 Tax=Azorhizobium oxalatiphilum TaxID=980631 RepID=A0A917C0P6_9HYPH|nr:TM2 domain-containing protein [Azorhizobium oxalatiphilum]GGF64826.1 hypothetical protein GCM10007301_25750 [Azorhizobium oxalatiphilum]